MLSPFFNKATTINCRGKLISFNEPLVMGIINVTPDSFFQGSRFTNEAGVLNRVQDVINQGGSMVDVGAYSSRPGAVDVSVQLEIKRIIPVIKAIRDAFPEVIISVDTFRASVAQNAVEVAGADIINDISGGDMDVNMFDTIAALNVPYILMHMQGTPQNMQNNPVYNDVVAEVSLSLAKKVDALRAKGVNDIIIDPGFGFGKTINHNYQLLARLNEFNVFELPLLVGVSRKSMIHKLLNISVDEALNGTSVSNSMALSKGADILRVHDVKEAVECVKIVRECMKWG